MSLKTKIAALATTVGGLSAFATEPVTIPESGVNIADYGCCRRLCWRRDLFYGGPVGNPLGPLDRSRLMEGCLDEN